MGKADAFKWGGRLMAFGSLVFFAFAPNIFPESISLWVVILSLVVMVAGIALSIYGSRLIVKERKEQQAKSLIVRKRNKDINNILNTVEAMDNRLYELLPNAEKQLLAKPDCGNIFTFCNIVSASLRIIFNARNGVERLSEFMDEKQIGLAQQTQDDTYEELDGKLNQLLRLKSIKCRNLVYGFVRFSYGFNSALLYFRTLKTLDKIPLFAKIQIRHLNNIRQQGIGNMLTRLSLRMEKCKG